MVRLPLVLALSVLALGCRTKEEVPLDLDHDGVTEETDCDDQDALVYPGADELCDGLDNDCDGEVDEEAVDAPTWFIDADEDGFGGAESQAACEAPRGYVDSSTDCDDSDPLTAPGASELCDGEDNDCDGEIDEDPVDPTTWYGDADGDGFGDPADQERACEPPSGYVSEGTDCDDDDPAYYPGAPEEDCADPEDYNCDGSVGYADADGDGYAACEECDDTVRSINPSAAEVCDGVDNDCNGTVDGSEAVDALLWYADVDEDGYGDLGVMTEDCDQPSGYVADSTDCDDSDSGTFPGGTEVCDDNDNDCDGDVDEDATDADTWYIDADGDGYGGVATKEECDQPSGYVSDGTDCDDSESAANPGATETCDELDNDCDGDVDEGVTTPYYADGDGDGYGDADVSVQGCSAPSGFVGDDTDCDDDEATAYPGGTEVCDELDNDCDGDVDEGVTSTFYLDRDGDTYGDDDTTVEACSAPSSSYVSTGTDCDDLDSSIHPGATEGCDGADYNCDGDIDNDNDGDGYSDDACGGQDCDDDDDSVNPDGVELCDTVDNDCDGTVDNDEEVLGDDTDCPGYSCEDIIDARPTAADGDYYIDPTASGSPSEVYCDMSTDGGGYTFLKVDYGSATSASTAETYCATYGMQLFIPRTEDHLVAAYDIAMDSSIGPSAANYLYIMGIYPNYSGATCTSRALKSGSSGCNWSASDGQTYWVTDRTDITEPNGDNSTTSSMYYSFNTDGSISWYNDISSPGYTSRYFTCDVGDKY